DGTLRDRIARPQACSPDLEDERRKPSVASGPNGRDGSWAEMLRVSISGLLFSSDSRRSHAARQVSAHRPSSPGRWPHDRVTLGPRLNKARGGDAEPPPATRATGASRRIMGIPPTNEDSHEKRELDLAEAHSLEQGKANRSEAATLGKACLVDTDQA